MTDVDLTWQPANSYVALTDYIVSYRPTGGSAWVSLTSTPSTTTSERVSGLLRDTSYEFRVSAKTDVEGPASASVLARTMSGIPAKPTMPTANAVASTSMSLSWVTVSGNGSPLTDYDITYRLSNTTPWVTLADGVSVTPVSFVTALSPAKSYEFRVRGKTAVGVGPWSNSLVVSTLTVVPGAVPSINTTSLTPSSLSVVWGAAPANGAPVQDYIVEFKRANDVSWQTWNDGISPLLSTTISGLSPGNSYVIRVSAKSQFGTGPSSLAPASITLNGRPLKVASLTAQQTTSSALLSWAAASPNGSPVTDYFIDYRPADVSSWSRFSDGVSPATRATVTGLTPNVTYYFRVTAVSAFGTSAGIVTTIRTLP
jgi:hypothetical protein